MKNEKKVRYKTIGEVAYTKNARARNLTLRIDGEGKIRVTVPGWCSFSKAEAFVLNKEHWIRQKLEKVEKKGSAVRSWGPGDQIAFRRGSMFLVQGNANDLKITPNGSDYEIFLPRNYDPGNAAQRKELLEKIAATGLMEAKKQLPGVLQEIAGRTGHSYKRLTVRRMRTRWGSCSADNRISLNSALIFLPEELIEYVCAHELVHTVHKNHSRDFWHYLYGILPDAKERRKRLRQLNMIA